MKNLMKLLFFVIALTMTMESFAQIRFGVKGGLNLANMVINDPDEYQFYDLAPKTIIGFHMGATAEFSFSEKFAVEPGLLLSTKGYKFEEDGDVLSFNMNYLEIPINAIYKIDIGGAKILIKAGPYLGYAISGKWKASEAVLGYYGDEKEQKIKIGSDDSGDDIKPHDFGLNIGGGVEIKDITIVLQYGIGLANLSPYTVHNTKLKNNVIGISVGYKFGKK